MELKDLTEEQVIMIADLAYPYDKSEFEYRYQPFEPRDDRKQIYEDTPEYTLITFKSTTFGDKVEKIRIFIYGNLNLSMDIFRQNPKKIDLVRLGVHNQYDIFEKFFEWKLEKNPFYNRQPSEEEFKRFNRDKKLKELL